MHLLVSLILWIVGLVILYWVIRLAVRDAILAAWRIRSRGEKEAAGWNPQSGRDGFR
jgi:hypothetical protein